MMMQGKEGGGIIGSGKILAPPKVRSYQHRKGKGKHVQVRFETLCNLNAGDDFLRRSRLVRESAWKGWDSQSSGIEIPAEVAKWLEKAWNRFHRAANNRLHRSSPHLSRIRNSPADAEDIVGGLFSIGVHFSSAIRILASDIQLASRVAPASWGVSLFPERLCLNVGGLAVLQFVRNEVLFVVTGEMLSEISKNEREFFHFHQKYKYVPDAIEGFLSEKDLDSFGVFAAAHADLIERCALKRKTCFWPEAHSPSVLVMLRKKGFDVPIPGYALAAAGAPLGRKGVEDLDELDHVTVEGRRSLRTHLARERSRIIVERKKESVLKRTGALACEVCQFDFAKTYGSIGNSFAETHHTLPLASGKGQREVRSGDLAIVCSNCHRMLHRGNPVFTLDELRQRLKR